MAFVARAFSVVNIHLILARRALRRSARAAASAMKRVDADLDLRHVPATRLPGDIVELQSAQNPSGFVGLKRLERAPIVGQTPADRLSRQPLVSDEPDQRVRRQVGVHARDPRRGSSRRSNQTAGGRRPSSRPRRAILLAFNSPSAADAATWRPRLQGRPVSPITAGAQEVPSL